MPVGTLVLAALPGVLGLSLLVVLCSEALFRLCVMRVPLRRLLADGRRGTLACISLLLMAASALAGRPSTLVEGIAAFSLPVLVGAGIWQGYRWHTIAPYQPPIATVPVEKRSIWHWVEGTLLICVAPALWFPTLRPQLTIAALVIVPLLWIDRPAAAGHS